MITVFLVILLLFSFCANYFAPRWTILIIFSILMLCGQIAMVSCWQMGLVFATLAVPAALVGVYDYRKRKNIFLETETTRTALAVVSCGIIFAFIDQGFIAGVYDALPYLVFLDMAFKLLPLKWRMVKDVEGYSHGIYGIGGNRSVDSTVLSIICGLMLSHHYPYLIKEIAIGAAIFCLMENKTTAGLLGFVAALLLWSIFSQFYIFSGLIITGSAVVLFKYRKTMLDDSGRWTIWSNLVERLISRKMMCFGHGNGTFKVMMPMAGTNQIGKNQTVTIWAHSDILQFFTESGIFGCVAMLLLLINIIPGFGPNEWVFAAALIPNLIFNFPMHMAPECLFVTVFLKDFFLRN